MIRRLDPGTRSKIAAGEVVARPASVAVELVENALDAGAETVEIEVDGDGTDRIRVADDGRGMAESDAALAVERYTTSKLSAADDLETVETLGFRGEALPSIAAAAARLELTTNDGGPRGTRVVVDGGGDATDGEHDKTVSPAGRARGTTVEVTGLFSDRPARKKSLASPKAEFARVSAVVTRYALTRPDVRFVLRHDGRETLATPGTDRFADALLAVYGRDAASHASTFDSSREVSAAGETAAVEVDGALCHPEVTRSRRDHVHVSVNGRALAEPRLRRAVADGYGTLLPDGREPVGVVRLRLPPAWVDHNVHPAKDEVGFRDADAVAEAVESSVRDALSTADLRRSGEVAMDLDSSLAPVEAASVFDDLRVIGRFRGLYLLCEAGDELLVVDQHAAHERINYERLREAVESAGIDAVSVDPPATVSLSPTDAALLDANRDLVEKLGFRVAEFGDGSRSGSGTGTYRVEAVPAPLGRPFAPDALADVVADVAAGDDADPRDELLKDLACHPSIKAGDDLTDDDAARLVERLGSCETPYTCPHGRPTVLAIDEETFVRGFGRRSGRLG
ncbi:DNA mismatch repair protein MutL [Haloferax gibbonsii ATCC 33959]|uniref:DNA mismatch repair protein MutL n=1 Tax=Haloferax gibbonsii (strain ATCC 33959 / DSM 4427 / JCM 8863 / NBRC 102184 / NCIMB 2188 / Ma 2.38) TaxID=1227459 RepID=M0H410_HALGM|nr:DNA mismatch repair endonuclease MutL [Haloferax gibbonsii]ELZ79230.1 DNA mismatch repair protein MutL [Haloferax gibbonsii ATCC 33959]